MVNLRRKLETCHCCRSWVMGCKNSIIVWTRKVDTKRKGDCENYISLVNMGTQKVKW